MSTVTQEYKFQHNNDIDSTLALVSMFEAGWFISSYIEQDGYRWLWLKRYAETH